MNIPELSVDYTKRNEGVALKPYRCKAGKLTIGIGRNLEDKGLSVSEIEILYHNDLIDAVTDLKRIFCDWDALTEPQKVVLVDMRFHMGPGGFRSFKNMLNAINSGQLDVVPAHILDSKYARVDTPERAMLNAQTWERDAVCRA